MITFYCSSFIVLTVFGTSIANFQTNTRGDNQNRLLQRISVNKDGMFVDSYGRICLFHGINMLYKQKPWYDPHLLNGTWLSNYKEWGFNVVRFGTMWAGVEPLKGQYNGTYIKILQTIAENLNDIGAYSLLDLHQDVLSSKFTSYDGIPRWLMDTLPLGPHPYPWPFKGNFSNWGESYLCEAVGKAFQALYDNANGSQDYLVKFWEKITTVFKEQTSVIGYELINEPWAGDIYSNPGLLLPGIAGKDNLMPLYDILNSAIRKLDNNTLIFYEPVTWGIYGSGDAGTGFTTVPGGQMYSGKSVLSYHYYCWVLSGGDEHHLYPFWKRLLCDDILMKDMIKKVASDAKSTGGGAFLTEFGSLYPDGNQNSTGTIEMDTVMDIADQSLQSWTYLSDFYDDGGHVMWERLKPFVRAYARAVSGTPIHMTFNVKTASFMLSFLPNPTIEVPTEIFIPKLHYSNGINVTITSGIKWDYSPETNVVNVYTSNLIFKPSEEISISIKPK